MQKFVKFFKDKDSVKFSDPRQPVFALDHNVQDTSPENLKKYKTIEDFARKHNVDFYPAGRGIGHQVSSNFEQKSEGNNRTPSSFSLLEFFQFNFL